MSDYRLRLTVRNANLLRAIEARGLICGAVLAQEIGVGYAVLLGYVNLTRSPINKHGDLRECALKIAFFLKTAIDDLWSEEQCTPLDRNASESDVSFDQLATLTNEMSGDPVLALEMKQRQESVEKIIDSLSLREASVIKHRYGFVDGDERTLDEIGEMHGVTRETIRQNEAKALRKMRHPSRLYVVKELLR